MKEEDLRFAVDDARRRLEADVKLIGDIDKQAMSFLTLFVTLTAAGFTGGGGILLSMPKTFPAALGVGLLAFAVFSFVSAMLCVQVLWADDISLPGRDADFWLWADNNNIATDAVYRQYLENVAGKAARNRALNIRMSNALHNAKQAGAAAPFVGFAAALIAHQIL